MQHIGTALGRKRYRPRVKLGKCRPGTVSVALYFRLLNPVPAIMPMPYLKRCLPVLLAASLCAALLPGAARATRVMDLRVDQLMFAANELKSTLNLTPNQLTLWQQVSNKSSAILRTRQLRRDRLQAELKRRLAGTEPDLRSMTAGVEEEAGLAAAEDKQLRELWLDTYDALDDKQRQAVLQLFASQLERVDADPDRSGRPAGREGQGREGRGGPGGGRGQRSGGMGAPGS